MSITRSGGGYIPVDGGNCSPQWFPTILGDEFESGVPGWYRRIKNKDLPDIMITMHKATQSEVDQNTEAILGVLEDEFDEEFEDEDVTLSQDDDEANEDDLTFVTMIVDLYTKSGGDPDLTFAMVTPSEEAAKEAAIGTAMKHASDLALSYSALTNMLMNSLIEEGHIDG